MTFNRNILPYVTEMKQVEVRARDNVDHVDIIEVECQLKISNILIGIKALSYSILDMMGHIIIVEIK